MNKLNSVIVDLSILSQFEDSYKAIYISIPDTDMGLYHTGGTYESLRRFIDYKAFLSIVIYAYKNRANFISTNIYEFIEDTIIDEVMEIFDTGIGVKIVEHNILLNCVNNCVNVLDKYYHDVGDITVNRWINDNTYVAKLNINALESMS